MKYPIEFHREMVCIVTIEADSEEAAMEIAQAMSIDDVDDALGENELEYESGWLAAGLRRSQRKVRKSARLHPFY